MKSLLKNSDKMIRIVTVVMIPAIIGMAYYAYIFLNH